MKTYLLKDLTQRWNELEAGKDYPVVGTYCRCGSDDLVFTVKFEAGTPAKTHPYLRCCACKHESRGTFP